MARQLLNTGGNEATWDANIIVDRQANLMMQPRPPWNNEYATEYCLRECGFAAKKEQMAWHNEGLYDLADFLILTEQDVQDACDGFKKLAGRASFHPGIARTLRAKGFLRWLKHRHANGQPLDGQEFTLAACENMVQEIQRNKEREDPDSTEIKPPMKFKGPNWRTWEMQAINFFRATPTGTTHNLPLYYVIRPVEPPANLHTLPEEEQRIYNVQLQGRKYNDDKKRTYRFLHNWLADTPGRPWVEFYDGTQDGRQAWLALSGHYNGPDKVRGRVLAARNKLETTFYTGKESQMPWETFITHIKESYDTLERDGNEVHSQEQKVQMLFHRIRITNSLPESFRMTLNTLKDKERADANLDEYCTTLSTKLVDLKAERAIQTGFGRDRNQREISQVGSERGGRGRRDDGRRSPGGRGRGGRWGRGGGGGRGGGRGGRGNDNARIVINGVDVSDPTRNFSAAEFNILRQAKYADCLRHRRQEVRDADPRNVRRKMDQQYDARISALEAYTRGHQTGAEEVEEMSAITDANGTAVAGSRAGSHGSNFGANGANSGGRTVGGRARGGGRSRGGRSDRG